MDAAKVKGPAKTLETVGDTSLLRRLHAGDEEAAETLYERYATRLRSLARANLPSHVTRHMDEEDIVQSVFRTFFQGASQGKFEVPAGEDLWKLLLVITLNKIRNCGAFLHAARRDSRITVPIDRLGPTRTPTQEAGLDSPQLACIVRDVLERLPAQHRDIIELRLEGHEVSEIAARVNRSKRTVERLLQESRVYLSTLLDKGD